MSLPNNLFLTRRLGLANTRIRAFPPFMIIMNIRSPPWHPINKVCPITRRFTQTSCSPHLEMDGPSQMFLPIFSVV